MNKKYFINSWYEEDTQDVENNSYLRSATLSGRCSSAGDSSTCCLSSSPQPGSWPWPCPALKLSTCLGAAASFMPAGGPTGLTLIHWLTRPACRLVCWKAPFVESCIMTKKAPRWNRKSADEEIGHWRDSKGLKILKSWNPQSIWEAILSINQKWCKLYRRRSTGCIV